MKYDFSYISNEFDCVRQLSDADKMPDVDNSKGKRYILSHIFRSFSPWSVDSLIWGPMHHHARKNVTEQTLLILWTPGNKEKGKSQKPSVPFRTCTNDVTSNQQAPHPKESTAFQ